MREMNLEFLLQIALILIYNIMFRLGLRAQMCSGSMTNPLKLAFSARHGSVDFRSPYTDISLEVTGIREIITEKLLGVLSNFFLVLRSTWSRLVGGVVLTCRIHRNL